MIMKKTLLILAMSACFGMAAGQTNEDRGFIHPGGLHTQSDFDRIKQQLAAGNKKVTQAYNILKNAEYAQSTAATYPLETIVRGGGSGENYIQAARGATIAYQNALRWKIEGNEACAKHAVQVLMAWCNTTKNITGNSDQCLAKGLYGYQFAQAAELMRDYEGWKREDFAKFQRWMLDVWYPGCMNFLRYRNGTWENSSKWWEAPGHYWSNWGLCNAMAVISIGILCDDVFIYNQGMSFIKYDQVGTFKDPRTDNPIRNDGLTEFWGNLIVTTSEWDKETGAYGKVGQMNESGRDTGHAAMALGLAVDIAHVGWNQGDDLFSYMDHRLAAGIEYVAAQCESVSDLPWTNYHYGTNGLYYTDSRTWIMTSPALGVQMRPYWATVIGHYEGIKGVKMPFAEMAYNRMGIDAGGMGSTSGGYDHLGYSVLMNTYDDGTQQAWLNPNPPVELQPEITYNGKTIEHNELGGLVNKYTTTPVSSRALAAGTQLTLRPCLPQGEEDTGKWKWNTGETTKEINVTANRSFIYRVTYTNAKGVESTLCFPIAVQEDTHDSKVKQTIKSGGETKEDSVIVVRPGASVTMTLDGVDGFGNYIWDDGKTSNTKTLTNVEKNMVVKGCFQNQGGKKTWKTFYIYVNPYDADATRKATNGNYRIHHIPTDTYLTNRGDSAVLQPLDNAKDKEQAWTLSYSSLLKKYALVSIANSACLKTDGGFVTNKISQHVITFAKDADCCAFSDKDQNYWHVNEEGKLTFGQWTLLNDFAFELQPYDPATAINGITERNEKANSQELYTVNGMRTTKKYRGIIIKKASNGQVNKLIKK